MHKSCMHCVFLVVSSILLVGKTNGLEVRWQRTGRISDVFGEQIFSAFESQTGDRDPLLDVYLVTLDNSLAAGGSGTSITALDLAFYGTFAQVQDAGFGKANCPSPRFDSNWPPEALAQDTHFLPRFVIPGDPIPAPTEGSIGLGWPATGLSDDLVSNPIAIAGSAQAPIIDIAQIVVLAGTSPAFSFQGEIAVAENPNPIPVSGVAVPEPETISLVTVLALLVAAFRCRFVLLPQGPKSRKSLYSQCQSTFSEKFTKKACGV